MAKKRLPVDFNYQKPDNLEVTNPVGAENQAAGIPTNTEYPKHLHKYAGPGLMHDYVVVTDAASEAQAKRDGFMSPQDANEVGRKAEAKAAAAPAAKAPKVKGAKKAPAKAQGTKKLPNGKKNPAADTLEV